MSDSLRTLSTRHSRRREKLRGNLVPRLFHLPAHARPGNERAWERGWLRGQPGLAWIVSSTGVSMSSRLRIGLTPWKYLFDVTSAGQRSPPWPCNSVKDEVSSRVQCVQPTLHRTNLQQVSRLSIAFLGSVVMFNEREDEPQFGHFVQLPLPQNRGDRTAGKSVSVVSILCTTASAFYSQ